MNKSSLKGYSKENKIEQEIVFENKSDRKENPKINKVDEVF